MAKSMLHLFLCWMPFALFSQESPGNFLRDAKTGCTVWFKHTFAEDSATWSGGCNQGFAEGEGVMVGYTQGKETSRYVGEMKAGKPDGQGVFTFWGDRRLEGHFEAGEPLFLPVRIRADLHKVQFSNQDSTGIYMGDNNEQQLYYHVIVPSEALAGAIVLLPGTWETTEHLLSSNAQLCALAHDHHLAVIVPSINQRLALGGEVLATLNGILADAAKRWAIPTDKVVMGGWSMGGLFSLRYAEYAMENRSLTALKPAAVFSVDGPCDLEGIHAAFVRKLKANPSSTEPQYGIREMETSCGGAPATAAAQYQRFSCYSHALPEGGNAAFLKSMPVRIYCDVDPVWWLDNRGQSLYDMNALDHTAMIQTLRALGNQRAEFINAFQKGYRLEGNRHPHSWSIVEPQECLEWVLECLK